MLQRTSNKHDTTPPTITLRRSPRFHQTLIAEPIDPKTPKPEPHRRTRPISSTIRRRGNRSASRTCLQKVDEFFFPNRVNLCLGKLEKRVTRSSCRDLDNTTHGCSSGEWIYEEGVTVSISKQFKGKSPKNKVKHSKKRCDSDSDQLDVLAITENQVLDEELSKKDRGRIENGVAVTTAVVVREEDVNVRDNVNKKQKNIGVKRTRNQLENTMGITQGWSKDQELALERAYLEAKPTPHFWKKVSRLVISYPLYT